MATKRKKAKRPVKRKAKKGKKKKASKKKPFGGYTIKFAGCSDSLEKVFGSKPVTPSDMTKKIWGYVKRKRLAKK